MTNQTDSQSTPPATSASGRPVQPLCLKLEVPLPMLPLMDTRVVPDSLQTATACLPVQHPMNVSSKISSHSTTQTDSLPLTLSIQSRSIGTPAQNAGQNSNLDSLLNKYRMCFRILS